MTQVTPGHLTKAMELLIDIDRKDISTLVLETISKMCEGEIIHGHGTSSNLTAEEYLHIVARKTASLFSASCVCGAKLVIEDENLLDMVSWFGTYYGMAFQLLDDCLDKNGTDLDNGTITLPHIYGDESCQKTLDLVDEYLDKAKKKLSEIEETGKNIPEEILSLVKWAREEAGKLK